MPSMLLVRMLCPPYQIVCNSSSYIVCIFPLKLIFSPLSPSRVHVLLLNTQGFIVQWTRANQYRKVLRVFAEIWRRGGAGSTH